MDSDDTADSEPAASESGHTTLSRRDWLTTLSASALGVTVGTATVSQSARAANPGEQLWAFETGGRVESSPTVADGTVYVGSLDNNLYAVDAVTGDQQWAFETGDYVDSSPTVADGTVYIGSHDDYLYAVDPATGDLKWEFNVSSEIDTSSPTVADSTVYVVSGFDLYAVDAATGDQQWAFEPGRQMFSSPTVADGTVYVGSNNDYLYALDAATGNEQWAFETGGRVESSPTVADGIVYVGSGRTSSRPPDDFGNLYAVDGATGSEQWAFQTDQRVESSPTVADGTAYVVGDDSLYAVDAATGDQQWVFKPSGEYRGFAQSSPTVADGTVYVGSIDGTVGGGDDSNLYAVDAATGEQEWASETGDIGGSSPTVADGTVYVGSDDYNLYAVETAHGESSSGSRVHLGTLGHHDDTAPTVGAAFSVGTSVVNRPVEFDASASSGSIRSYEWDFTGDGTTDATGQQVSHTFSPTGTYTVTLTITTETGTTETTSKEITVVAAPSADIRVTPSSPTVGQSVSFIATTPSAGGDRTLTSYEWDFTGDGTIDATGQEVTHAFGESGTYTVILTVTDSKDVTARITRDITVGAPPSPQITLTPADPVSGRSVTLSASQSTASENRTLIGYEWDLTGDGTTDATGQEVTYTFPDPGTYTVSLTVTDSETTTATTTSEVTVVAAPSAVVEVTPPNPVAGEPITFDATNSTVGGTRALSGFEWAFGDDDTFTQRDLRVTHTFEEPGTYTVRFRLTDSAGASDTTSVTVTIDQPPSPTPTASPTPTETPAPTASSTPTASPTPTETPTPEPASALGTGMSLRELLQGVGVAGITGLGILGGVAYRRRSTDTDDEEESTSDEESDSVEEVYDQAEETLSEADTARQDGDYETAIDWYETAIDQYETAREQFAPDDERYDAIEYALSTARESLQELQDCIETRSAVTEMLTTAESDLQTALTGHTDGEVTVPELRYRQARDRYDKILDTIANSDYDLFEDGPIEITRDTATATPPRDIENVPAYGDGQTLAEAGIDSAEAFAGADDDTLSSLAGVHRMIATAWWDSEVTTTFASRADIETRREIAQQGFDQI